MVRWIYSIPTKNAILYAINMPQKRTEYSDLTPKLRQKIPNCNALYNTVMGTEWKDLFNEDVIPSLIDEIFDDEEIRDSDAYDAYSDDFTLSRVQQAKLKQKICDMTLSRLYEINDALLGKPIWRGLHIDNIDEFARDIKSRKSGIGDMWATHIEGAGVYGGSGNFNTVLRGIVTDVKDVDLGHSLGTVLMYDAAEAEIRVNKVRLTHICHINRGILDRNKIQSMLQQKQCLVLPPNFVVEAFIADQNGAETRKEKN